MTASEAKARGIQNRELADAVDRGELVKTARGLYCTPETWEDEYVRAQHRFARGIFFTTRRFTCSACPTPPPNRSR